MTAAVLCRPLVRIGGGSRSRGRRQRPPLVGDRRGFARRVALRWPNPESGRGVLRARHEAFHRTRRHEPGAHRARAGGAAVRRRGGDAPGLPRRPTISSPSCAASACSGILAVGMAIVIIGRGIDLSAVAIMAMSRRLVPADAGTTGSPGGVGAGAGARRACSPSACLNGFLIAYADVPAIFATLASGAFVYGFARSQLIAQDATPVPPDHWIEAAGRLPDRRACRSRSLFFSARRLPRLSVPALRQMGPLRLPDGRQFPGGAQHGHSGPADDRPALRHLRADRRLGRRADGVQPAQHQHAGGELHPALRRHPGGGDRRHRPVRRQGRHAQRDRRRAADRHHVRTP